jgi:uncharacterized protein
MTPAFKQGDYYTGINLAVESIIKATEGVYLIDGETKNDKTPLSLQSILILFVVVAEFLVSILSRSKSWWLGGVIGGVFGALLSYSNLLGISLPLGSVVTIFLCLIGLLFDYVVSREYAKSVLSGSRTPWWIGGNPGGYHGTSNGSSFSGFGGGRSGGGGASGSW